VADELGTAVLKITVDDGEALRKLQTLRSEIEQTGRVDALGGQTSAQGAGILRQINLTRQLTQETKRTKSEQQSSVILGGGPDVAQQRVQAEQRIAATRNLGYESALRFERLLQGAVKNRQQAETRRTQLGRRAGGAISSGLIGGGFPLLFGQGAGAAVGGAAGGVAGGALGGGFGFALSVVGTAIGVAFDEALQKGEALAQGLSDPIGQFDKLREAAILSSKATEKEVAALIASGREAEAAALVRLDLAQKFGDTSDFADLGKARDDLARAFTSLGIVMGDLVAGPLAEFLSRLAAVVSVPAAKEVLDRRLEDLGSGADARERLIAEARTNVAGQLQGLTGAERLIRIYNEANRLLDEQEGKTEGVAEAERRRAAAAERNTQIQANTLAIIDAQAGGNQRRLLLLRRENVELEKQQALSVIDPSDKTKGEGIQRRALEDTRKLTQEILALDRDRFASAQQQVGQFVISSNALERQLQVAQKLANISTAGGVTILRDNAAFVEGIFASIESAVDRQQEIENRIRAAQIRGGERSQIEITDLTLQQVVAAQQTRLELTKGAEELRNAGQQLSRDVRNSIVEFTRIRSDEGGLNQFLSPEAQGRRAQEDFRRLLPQFREAQAQFFNITGQRAPEFQGPTAGVNEALRNFITAVDREFNATQNLIQTTQALVQTNDSLAKAQLQLADATAQLAAKTWNVAVNVQGASGAQIVGDVVGALS
jgi:hypothetical protein